MGTSASSTRASCLAPLDSWASSASALWFAGETDLLEIDVRLELERGPAKPPGLCWRFQSPTHALDCGSETAALRFRSLRGERRLEDAGPGLVFLTHGGAISVHATCRVRSTPAAVVLSAHPEHSSAPQPIGGLACGAFAVPSAGMALAVLDATSAVRVSTGSGDLQTRYERRRRSRREASKEMEVTLEPAHAGRSEGGLECSRHPGYHGP